MAGTFGAATSDRLTVPAAASLNDKDPFTWVLWVRPTTLTTSRALLRKNTKRLELSGTGGNVSFVVNRATTNTTYTTNTTPLSVTGDWAFLVVVFDSSAAAGEIVNIYKGTLTAPIAEATYGTATDGSGTPTTESSQLAIGNTSAGSPTAAFQGDVALVAIFDRALTPAEIEALRVGPTLYAPAVRHPGLVGLWRPCDFGLDLQPDLSGNGNHATPGGVTLASPNIPIPALWLPRLQPPMLPPSGATQSATAAIAAVSAVSVAAKVAHAASAAIAGASALAATARAAHAASAQVNAASTTTAAIRVNLAVSAAIAAQSALAATPKADHAASALIAASSVASASARLALPAAAAVTGQSSLFASAILAKLVAAAITAQSGLSATAALRLGIAAVVSAQSSLTASPLLSLALQAHVGGQSVLAARLVALWAARASIVALSALSAAGTVTVPTVPLPDIPLAGSRSLTATLSGRRSVDGSLAGSAEDGDLQGSRT